MKKLIALICLLIGLAITSINQSIYAIDNDVGLTTTILANDHLYICDITNPVVFVQSQEITSIQIISTSGNYFMDNLKITLSGNVEHQLLFKYQPMSTFTYNSNQNEIQYVTSSNNAHKHHNPGDILNS